MSFKCGNCGEIAPKNTVCTLVPGVIEKFMTPEGTTGTRIRTEHKWCVNCVPKVTAASVTTQFRVTPGETVRLVPPSDYARQALRGSIVNDLQIVIPSKGRMPRQATLSYLPPYWCERTTLVVNEADAAVRTLYDLRGASVLVHPPDVDTIAKKRQWIIEQPQFNKIVMFDDDLRFACRREGSGTKLFQATYEEINENLDWLNIRLNDIIHAGWSARQGNNNFEGRVAHTARMMFVLGYRCDVIRQLVEDGRVTLGRVHTREDMELTVQLLKLGYDNDVTFDIAADQVAGFAAKGGCSDERTIASTSDDAETFAALHPGIVKVVEKSYKGSPNRKEVVVQWKKAFSARVQ